MFAWNGRCGGFGRMSGALMAMGAAAVLASSGEALADRGGGRGGGHGGGSCHGGGYQRGGGGCGWGGRGSSVSISIGSGWRDCGGWGWGYSSGWRGCGSSYAFSYSAPVYQYCPPPVVVAPCPAPVVYTAPVVYSTPVVVERPVEVQRVVERPVYIERVVEKPVVVERPAPVERPVEAAAAPGYRDRELGDAYMKLADWHNAARVYSRYLGAWDKDGTATRNLGLAQVAAGAPREGFANVVRGYQLEPGLTERAMRVSDLGGPAGLQQVADAAVHAADSLNTSDAWFTVAVVQSMLGQTDSALAALKKARDAGLSTELLDAMTLKIASTKP